MMLSERLCRMRGYERGTVLLERVRFLSSVLVFELVRSMVSVLVLVLKLVQ